MNLLIKSNDKLYTLHSNTYDINTHMYIGVPIQNCDIYSLLSTSTITPESLTAEVNIGDEVFRPIDKFDTLSILSDSNYSLNLHGIKSSMELVTLSSPIQLHYDVIRSINKFFCNYMGNIKFVVSNDGVIWKSYDGNDFITLPVTIPFKKNENFTSIDYQSYNTAKNIIYSSGIEIANMESIDFNKLDTESVYFAFLLIQSKYSSTEHSILQNFSIDYHEQNHLMRMNHNDFNSDVYKTKIQVTPKSDCTQARINSLTQLYYINTPYNNKMRLIAPELSGTLDEDAWIVNLTWTKPDFCNYYKIFVNGIPVDENYSNVQYSYQLGRESIYEFSVRAFPDEQNNKFLPSVYSNIVLYEFNKYLSAQGKYIAVSKDNNLYRLKAKEP